MTVMCMRKEDLWVEVKWREWNDDKAKIMFLQYALRERETEEGLGMGLLPSEWVSVEMWPPEWVSLEMRPRSVCPVQFCWTLRIFPKGFTTLTLHTREGVEKPPAMNKAFPLAFEKLDYVSTFYLFISSYTSHYASLWSWLHCELVNYFLVCMSTSKASFI